MRFHSILSLALLPGAALGFVTPPAFGVKQVAAAPLFDRKQMADSSLDVHNLRSLIDNLAPDNFEASLDLIEPLLVNECVGQECEDYLSQLKDKCEDIGVALPDGFAPSHH